MTESIACNIVYLKLLKNIVSTILLSNYEATRLFALLKTAKICIDRTTVFTYCNFNVNMPDQTSYYRNDDWTMLH